MQVLKFGGSSVANAQNMAKVIDIVVNAVDRDRTILVSSAISGCTDTLIKIGTLASQRDQSYKALIDGLQKQHHDIIDELLPREKQQESLEVCDGLFDLLRSITQGVYLLGELSPASLDAISLSASSGRPRSSLRSSLRSASPPNGSTHVRSSVL